MPIHDWSAVAASTFHEFHRLWTAELCRRLNDDGLPGEYYAVTFRRQADPEPAAPIHLGPKPRARIVQRAEGFSYALRADTVVIRREQETVAVVEVVTPGLKASGYLRRKFLADACYLLDHQIHLLVVDLFPPTPAVPAGLPSLLWDEYTDRPLERFEGEPLAVCAFDAGDPTTAYLEPLAVGRSLPDMPLFVEPGGHVPAALEATYTEAWRVFPQMLKDEMEGRAG